MEQELTNTEVAMMKFRRGFALPETDVEYLDSLCIPWESVIEKNVMRIVIHDYPVPDRYNHTQVSLYLRIENGYPDTQIDMAYFYPPLERKDGKPIKALSTDNFDGKVWQRWSRHRTNANPWRIGIDCVATHMALVKAWLEREFRRSP
jgi:hypothetical protein